MALPLRVTVRVLERKLVVLVDVRRVVDDVADEAPEEPGGNGALAVKVAEKRISRQRVVAVAPQP
jgi:hypothetical protein